MKNSTVIVVAFILVAGGYIIVNEWSLNNALAECAKAGGNIHVTWNGRHYCNRENK